MMGEIEDFGNYKNDDETRLIKNIEHEMALFKPFLESDKVNEIAINYDNTELLTWESGVWKYNDVSPIDLEAIGTILANYMQNSFDVSNPYLSGQLPDGSRIELTMPPACPNNTYQLNLRKHKSVHFTLEQFEEMGYFKDTRHTVNVSLDSDTRKQIRKYLNEEQLHLLELAESNQWMLFLKATQELSGLNGVISGATGSGKTAFLQSLLDLVSEDERILTVEDSDEIKLFNHKNHQKLYFKRGLEKGRKVGGTPTEALMATLRKTGDRVILGELRGSEALNYIEDVCSTGSNGTLTSIHANDSRSVFSRIASLMKRDEAAKTISFSELYEKIYPIIHYIIHLKFNKRENRRQATEIYYDPVYALYREGIR